MIQISRLVLEDLEADVTGGGREGAMPRIEVLHQEVLAVKLKSTHLYMYTLHNDSMNGLKTEVKITLRSKLWIRNQE